MVEKSSSTISKRENRLKVTEPDNDRIFRQLLLLIFYLGTVLLGSIHNIIKPLHNSYFSQKDNFFNVWFVKLGWLWTSLIFVLYSWNVIHVNKTDQFRSLLRLGLASIYWYLVTQWFFGPSITEWVYVATGGKCTLEDSNTQLSCKKQGASWSGGHDISGHCLLLTHSSLLLWEELSVLLYWPECVKRAKEHKKYTLSLMFILILWWHMLLMTSVYNFHNFREKLSGTVFGILYWVMAYTYIFPMFARHLLPSNKDPEDTAS
ncbi:inositol phospholipid biosynthesis protein scs3 [Gigaspora margarita]|uniref:Inositol phospholipid biosynthesis protein scs3 n=1 Tax=Gigaspora margarita TaxID=4874 RepID=A0A8H4AZ66_GIGMA|nr:inositol phospholipid biosynthesis protein scs3 [Gigaspora margarita]